jgi:hypothetical protein
VWACPCCAGRIQSERVEELNQLVARGRADALGTVMLTLTVRHAFSHDLRETRDGLARAWKRFQQSRVWKRVQKSYGVVGFVRAFEVKHGRTAGWHPHIHVLLLVSEWQDAERDLHAELTGLWRAAVVRELGREHEPDDEHGCHVAPWKLRIQLARRAALRGVRSSCSKMRVAAMLSRVRCGLPT